MQTVEFNETSRAEIAKILPRYPTKQAALLPVLWVAQRQFGWISGEAMELVARTLEISPAHVFGVVTFYTMYHKKKPGKYHLQVCRTLSCAMMGADKLLNHLKNRLGIDEGDMTADGKFSLATVECLASCGTAPAMQVNETYYENLTTEELDRILASLD